MVEDLTDIISRIYIGNDKKYKISAVPHHFDWRSHLLGGYGRETIFLILFLFTKYAIRIVRTTCAKLNLRLLRLIGRNKIKSAPGYRKRSASDSRPIVGWWWGPGWLVAIVSNFFFLYFRFTTVIECVQRTIGTTGTWVVVRCWCWWW